MTASIAEGNRSEETYRSFRGDTVDLNRNRSAYVQPSYLNIGLSSGKLEVRALYDNYRFRTYLYEIENKQFSTYATYQISLGNRTSLTPKVSYANQLPWRYTDQYSSNEDDWYEYQVRAQRLAGTLTLDHRFTRRLQLSSGVETQYQHARDLLFEDGQEGNFGDVAHMGFMSYSLFSQLFWKSYFANLTAGLRYEYRDGFGGAVVPRFAATKHIDKWHVKLLYSHAYRMPGIENMNLAIGTLKPETSKVAEAELGYQFTKDMMLSLNAFRMGVEDIIVYGYNILTLEESYVNKPLTGSKGLEANFQIQQAGWRAQLGYSFYKPIRGNSVDDYQVEDNSSLYLGIPAHKISFNGTVDLTKKLHLNTTATWHSERWGYTRFADEEMEELLLERFDPYLLLNVFLRYEHLLPNLHLGAGAYNILNTQHGYIQPYAGENTPYPNAGKEWVFKLQYELPFKK